MTQHFIVAQSLHQAQLTAENDWGWTRIGRAEWRHPTGNAVRYLGNSQDLRGRCDCIIHLGHRWRDNPDLRDLEWVSKGRNWTMVEQ